MDTVVSDQERAVFEFVNFMFICSIVGLFGITANAINCMIFYKQGFSNTANIAFFGLAISDLCCLIALEWSSFCLNPFFAASGVPWNPQDVMYLSGAWPHICFCRITSYITVYITSERYLSMVMPLKAKQLVTNKRAIVAVCLIFTMNILTLIPEYATSYLGWRFVPEKNRTLVGIIFTNNRNEFDGLTYVMHSVFSMMSFFGVVVFTLLLAIQLKRSSEWRKKATLGQDQQRSRSTRDQRTVKMIVLIATILIICYTPGAIIAMASFVLGPEFNIKGRYINIVESVWSIALSFQSVNSSMNIFLYYRMSSKYRQTFHDFFLANFKRVLKEKLIVSH